MDKESSDPISILGLEDNSDLLDKNIQMTTMTDGKIHGLPCTFPPTSSNLLGKVNVNPEAARIAAAKPPAKITMNIPTFPTFFPKLQSLVVQTKKMTQSQEVKTNSPIVNNPLSATTSPAKGAGPLQQEKLNSISSGIPVIKPIATDVPSTGAEALPQEMQMQTISPSPVIISTHATLNTVTNYMLKTAGTLGVSTGYNSFVANPMVTVNTSLTGLSEAAISTPVKEPMAAKIAKTSMIQEGKANTCLTMPISTISSSTGQGTGLSETKSSSTVPKPSVTVSTNITKEAKIRNPVTGAPPTITVSSNPIKRIVPPETNISKPVAKPVVTFANNTMNVAGIPETKRCNPIPDTISFSTDTTSTINATGLAEVKMSYHNNPVPAPKTLVNVSSNMTMGKGQGLYEVESRSISKPLVTVTTSTIKVFSPSSSPKLQNLNKLISPTAVTIVNTTSILGVGKSHETIRGPQSQIISGGVLIPINKSVPVLGPDPLDSSSLIVPPTPEAQDPLIHYPHALSSKIPMQIDPPEPDPVLEPFVFDSNLLSNTCSLPGCKSIQSGNIRLFNFPRNRARRWCEILGIPHEGIPLKDLGGLRICGAHFEYSQFVDNSFNRELKLTAMPRNQVNPSTTKQVLPQVTKFDHRIPIKVSGVQESENQQKLVVSNISSTTCTSISENTVSTPLPLEQTIGLPLNSYIQPTSMNNATRSNNANRHSESQAIVTNIETGKQMDGNTHVPQAQTAMSIKNMGAQSVDRTKKLPNPMSINTVSQKFPSPNARRPSGPGPKSQRKASLSPINPIIPLGPYARPTAKLPSGEVKPDYLANLVMPSEDWSVNVYPMIPSPSRTGKSVFTISETILNSDCVEIVRKSITIQPTWAMKFSVMSRDMSHFNLGLDVSDITDIQAVLDNFESLVLCRGLVELSLFLDSRRSSALSIRTQLDRHVDNIYRSIECPLLLVVNNSKGNGTGKVCSTCQVAIQTLNSTMKMSR